MARRLRNWTFKDVVDFLKDHDFYLSEHGSGSHYVHFISRDKKFTVEVNRIPSLLGLEPSFQEQIRELLEVSHNASLSGLF